MNLLYLKYAVEVAACGSINRAAEKLYIDQPNLSRAIRELETSLGVTVFERSARGMRLTPDGEIFLQYAKSILDQVETVEHLFRQGASRKRHFSVSVPRASYIAEAFSRFSQSLGPDVPVDAIYRETNAMRVIKNILQEDYKLGIVRYAEMYDRQYKEMLEEKGMEYEVVTSFVPQLVACRESPLFAGGGPSREMLAGYIGLVHADPYVPTLPQATVRREEPTEQETDRRIYVFDRASQFTLLSSNPQTYMWCSPIPPDLLERYGLVQRPCAWNTRGYKDVMIYRHGYKLTDLDSAFIAALCQVKRELFR